MFQTSSQQRKGPAYPAQQPSAPPGTNQAGMRTGQPGSSPGPALNMQSFQQGPSSTNVYTPFGNFPNLQAFQNQQDAFVQQHLQNQAGYNTDLMAGQSPQRVPVMEAWQQAGDSIASGTYRGNPFATGDMAGLGGLFSQYGLQMPTGFQDQLMQMIGQQSAPSLYSPPTVGGMPQPPPPNAGGPGRRLYNPDRPGGDYLPPVGQDPAYQEWRRGISTDRRARPPEERAAQERMLYDRYLREQRQPQPAPATPGYGGAIGVPVDQRRFNDIIDRDGDGVDDRFQPGPGQPNPEWSQPIADSWRPQQPPPPAFAPPGAARPIPPSGEGTAYEPPPPLRAQPGTSGPGWRESGGVRIYDGFTANQGTGTPGVMGPDHIRPGVRRDPVTGQEVYDPFTDPIGTGGGPATPHNAPIGNTWGTGRPVPPPIRRDPILNPQRNARIPAPRRSSRNDLYLG